jgi:hypothetical protein
MEKQFNISGLNGYYLTFVPTGTVDSSNYLTKLIEHTDFFPKKTADSLSFVFKNASYSDPGVIIGSNRASGNSSLNYSEITKPNDLILNKTYYNTFTFYFKFTGSSLFGYSPNYSIISGADFGKHLNRLRIKLYVDLGANTVPLALSDLEFFHNDYDTFRSAAGYYDSGFTEGFRITTGNNSEPCIDLGYGTGATPPVDSYGTYNKYSQIFDNNTPFAPNGYNFRVTASIPNFTSKTTNNKDYKLVVKYYNIGVTGTTFPYNTSESMELMSNTYVWYESSVPSASTPESLPPEVLPP